jgi:thioesterase domain-containing protein/acyl carrier protein
MYMTGDRGRYRHDGNIEYSGRADGQIKFHGHRIELGEIEAVLGEREDVQQAVCVLREAALGDTRLIAFIVPASKGANPNREAMNAFLSERLPLYMLPQAYAVLERIPLTPSGKVDRKALPDVAYNSRKERTPPADETERIITNIWQETMNTTEIGVEDDFFALGGHSLLAVRLMAGIVREFGIEIPLRVFFSEPTVRGCARIIHQQPGKVSEVPPDTREAPFESDIVFPMRLQGTGTPIFLIAGVYADENGMYRYLSSLVHFLEDSQPIYGLRPRGLIKPAGLYESVQEIAFEYINDIRKIQPNGPFRLIGECVGGIVAYEIARQIEAAGDRVESLILMDTEYPNSRFRTIKDNISEAGHKLRRLAWFCLGLVLRSKDTMREIREVVDRRRANILPRTQVEIDHQRFKSVESRFADLAHRYNVMPYSGKIHLLINDKDHETFPFLGWHGTFWRRKKKVPAGLVLNTVRGDHISRLTTYGKETSEIINRILMESSRP